MGTSFWGLGSIPATGRRKELPVGAYRVADDRGLFTAPVKCRGVVQVDSYLSTICGPAYLIQGAQVLVPHLFQRIGIYRTMAMASTAILIMQFSRNMP
jgi:hypothetical protein